MSVTDQESASSSSLSLSIRLRDGSSDAWRELSDLYGPLVDSWCRRAGISASSRADIVQEVFLSVHRAIGQFDPTRPDSTFRGWLWTITRNVILQWLRRRGPEAVGGSSALAQLASIPDPWSDESSRNSPSTPDEVAALLRRALEQLRPSVEPRTWNAFWNTAVLGRSASDVAAELGISPAAVRQAKSRMLRRLRRHIGDL